MNSKVDKKELFRQAIRFGIVGVLATAIHYGIYWVLQHWMNVNIAYTIGYILSFIVNYLLSAKFTFKEKTNTENGIGFIGAHICNYLLQMVLLNIFIGLGVSKTLSPIPVYCISVPVNFLLVRFAFKRKGARK